MRSSHLHTYTHYFLEAVRRPYDPDGDGAVTVTEAHDFARRLTYQRSRGAQRPNLRSDILGGDPIVLAGSPGAPALPLLLSFDPALEGYRVRVDGQEKGALPGGLALPVGDHEVSIESHQGTVVASRALSLAPRQRLLVEDLLGGVGGLDPACVRVRSSALQVRRPDGRRRPGPGP